MCFGRPSGLLVLGYGGLGVGGSSLEAGWTVLLMTILSLFRIGALGGGNILDAVDIVALCGLGLCGSGVVVCVVVVVVLVWVLMGGR